MGQVAGFEDWERGLDELTRWHLARREGERYGILPTVREYAALMLREVGVDLGLEEAELRARHAAHYLAYAQAHRDDYDALQAELPDIFAGFDFVGAEETRNDEAVQDYTWALDKFLDTRGYWDEDLRWLQETSKACERLGDRAGLARTYNNIGEVHRVRGDYEAALEWYARSVALCEALGDRAGLARTLHNMGYIALAQADLRCALSLFTRSRDLYAAIGLEKDVAEEEQMIAQVQRRMGG